MEATFKRGSETLTALLLLTEKLDAENAGKCAHEILKTLKMFEEELPDTIDIEVEPLPEDIAFGGFLLNELQAVSSFNSLAETIIEGFELDEFEEEEDEEPEEETETKIGINLITTFVYDTEEKTVTVFKAELIL